MTARRLHAREGLHVTRDRGEAHPLLADIIGADLAWVTNDAVCSQIDPALWHPEMGEGIAEATATAKTLCASCPLVQPCRAYALTHRVTGVWGAMSARERNVA